MNDFETEQRLWEHAVKDEAARLIREGMPPTDALLQGRLNVSERRRREARVKAAAGATTHE